MENQANKEPSVFDNLTDCYTETMSHISGVDNTKAEMIASINDCLIAGKKHLPRLFKSIGGILVNGDTPAFKIDDNLVLSIKDDQPVAMLLVNPNGVEMLERPRYMVAQADELAETYGDKQFGQMICDALKKVGKHYKAINDSHLPAPMPQQLYQEVADETDKDQ